MESIHVGSLTVLPVLDGWATLQPSMFTTVDGGATVWSAHEHLIEQDGSLRMPVGVFVVRTGDRTVMFDAGVGVSSDPMFEGHALLSNLAAAGVGQDEIDTIVVSHLHSDHSGWLESGGGPTFPNATIWIGAADWTHFVDGSAAGPKRVARMGLVEDHVRLVDRDGESPAPGMTTRMTPGHTPGHMSTVLSSGDERMIVLGDALHCPAQLTESEWQFMYDVDKDVASRTREALLREAEEPGTVLLPAHFPGMTAARLLPAEGTRRWLLG